MSQIYCKKCGKEVMSNAKFCTSCGAPIENNNASNNGKYNAAKVNVQSSPTETKKVMKKSLQSGVDVYAAFSAVCIIFALFICLVTDPWNGLSLQGLGFAITFGFLAVVLQLKSIGKAIRRM